MWNANLPGPERMANRNADEPSEASGPEMIFGRNAVYEALRSGKSVQQLYVAKGLDWRGLLRDAIELARANHIPIQEAPREALDRLVRRGAQHQGIVAQVAEYEYASVDDLFAVAEARREPPFFLLLDRVQYISNFGALIRTAEAVGMHGVIIPEHRQAGITAEVRKASAGAIDHLTVAQVTNLSQTIQELKDRGVWVVGIEDDPQAQNFYEADLSGALAFVLGSELQGIGRLVKQRCDFLVKLPMWGKMPSLNVSVAGSIVLYEAKLQRLEKRKE